MAANATHLKQPPLLHLLQIINKPHHDPKTSINQQYGSDLKLNIFRPADQHKWVVRSRPLAKRCSPNDPRTPLLFLLSIPPLVLTRFSIELIHIFLFQSVSSKVLGQTLHSFSYNFVFPQQLTNHPSQIWRSDPSRGYTWLALSNDSTCSHQLDTHSAGEIFKQTIIVSCVNTGLNSNDWYDKCRQMVKSVSTKWLSSWWHEMSSGFKAR